MATSISNSIQDQLTAQDQNPAMSSQPTVSNVSTTASNNQQEFSNVATSQMGFTSGYTPAYGYLMLPSSDPACRHPVYVTMKDIAKYDLAKMRDMFLEAAHEENIDYINSKPYGTEPLTLQQVLYRRPDLRIQYVLVSHEPWIKLYREQCLQSAQTGQMPTNYYIINGNPMTFDSLKDSYDSLTDVFDKAETTGEDFEEDNTSIQDKTFDGKMEKESENRSEEVGTVDVLVINETESQSSCVSENTIISSTCKLTEHSISNSNSIEQV